MAGVEARISHALKVRVEDWGGVKVRIHSVYPHQSRNEPPADKSASKTEDQGRRPSYA